MRDRQVRSSLSLSGCHIPLTHNDTAIVLVDHQPGALAMVGSLPAQLVTNNAATLARPGADLNLPLVITSTREELEFLGATLPVIQAAAPKAYENRVRRAGTLNAFDDPAFVNAVAATNRPNLVIADGISTFILASDDPDDLRPGRASRA